MLTSPPEMPFSFFSHPSSAPTEISLSTSLPVQPMPNHAMFQNAQIPSAEVKSKKENRVQPTFGLSPCIRTSSLTADMVRDYRESRKGSQQVCIAPESNVSAAAVTKLNTPQPHIHSNNSKRSSSVGDCASVLSNELFPESSLASMGSSLEKGTKRQRHYTPTPTRGTKEENEPGQVSPSVRITSFVENSSAKDAQ